MDSGYRRHKFVDLHISSHFFTFTALRRHRIDCVAISIDPAHLYPATSTEYAGPSQDGFGLLD